MGKILASALHGNTPFWILTAVAVGMLLAGFIVPPTGQIDPSVLKGTAEVFGFFAGWAFVKALNKGVDATITHGSTTIDIDGKPDKHEDHHEGIC